MFRKHLAIVLILCLFCSSCATQSLWEATDPDEYIKIKYTDITEQELKDRGSKYIKDDNTFAYYVSKNSFDKLKDYTIRTVGTPFTIVVDATSLFIVGLAIGIVDNAIDQHRIDPSTDPYGAAESSSY